MTYVSTNKYQIEERVFMSESNVLTVAPRKPRLTVYEAPTKFKYAQQQEAKYQKFHKKFKYCG